MQVLRRPCLDCTRKTFAHKQADTKTRVCCGSHRHIKDDNSNYVITKLRTEWVRTIKRKRTLRNTVCVSVTKKEQQKTVDERSGEQKQIEQHYLGLQFMQRQRFYRQTALFSASDTTRALYLTVEPNLQDSKYVAKHSVFYAVGKLRLKAHMDMVPQKRGERQDSKLSHGTE